MRILNNIPLKFNQDKILGIIYHGNTNVSEHRKKELNGIIEDSYQLINPKALYTSLTIKKITNGGIILENEKRLKSSLLVKKLKCSPELIFYLITIGDKLEKRMRELSGDILQAFILDRIGTYALELSTEYLEKLVKKEKNYQKISKFSPGSTRFWNIEEQKVIFEILESEKIGVRLTDSYLMIPQKSVSGLMGLTRQEFYECQICKKECDYRRKKFNHLFSRNLKD